MSFIKQVIGVDKFVDLPSRGDKRVFYVVREPVSGVNSLVRGYIWNNGGYQPIVDPNFIIHCPYSKDGYDFTTIKDALDFLLTKELQVSLIVTPAQTYGSYPIDIQFTWVLSKLVENIESIVLKRMMGGGEQVIASNLIQYTVGSVGQHSVQQTLSGDAVYEITVIDTFGNVATAYGEVKYVSSSVQILEFKVSPDYWHERGDSNEGEFTLSWTLSAGKEYLSSIYVQDKIYSSDEYGEPVSLMDYTLADGSGTLTVTKELTESIVFKLSVVSVSSPDVRTAETVVEFISYIPISVEVPLSINPASSSGSQVNYTFTCTFNRVFNIENGGYLRLYQVDSFGEKILDSSNVFGGGYVNIEVLSSKFVMIQRLLTISQTTYFELEAREVDDFMNVSEVSSYASVSFNIDMEFTALSVSPVKDYMNNNGYQSGYLFTATFNNSLNDSLISLVNLSIDGVSYEINNYSLNVNVLSFSFTQQFTEGATVEFLLGVTYDGVELSRTVMLTMYSIPNINDVTFIHTGNAGQFGVSGTLTRQLIDTITVRFAGKGYSASSVIDGAELSITDSLNNFSFVTGVNTQTLQITETLNGGRAPYQISKSLTFTLYSITFVIKHNGTPVSGASVNINGKTITTNSSGQAVANALTNGVYSYSVSCSGYNTIQDNVQVNNANQTINISLTEVTPDHYVYFGYMTVGQTYGSVTIVEDAGQSALAALQQPSVVTGQSSKGTNIIDPVTIQYAVYPSPLQGHMFLASECSDYIGYKNVFFATLDNMWIYGQEHNVTINGKVYYLYVAKFRVDGEGDPTPEMTFSSVVI